MNREKSAEVDDADTGLPFLHSWGAVYALVLAVFVVTVAGLTALMLAYP